MSAMLFELEWRKRASWESERLSRIQPLYEKSFPFFLRLAMPDNCIDMGGTEFSLFSNAMAREY